MPASTQNVTIWDDTNAGSAVHLDGAALPGTRSIVVLGGSDGSNLRALKVGSDGGLVMSTATASSVRIKDGAGNDLTSSDLSGGVRALDVSVKEQPVADPANTVITQGEITTTATTADQIIVSYTVPAGKSFYLASFFISRITDNSVGAIPASLAVFTSPSTTVVRRRLGLRSTASGNVIWESIFPTAVQIALAGDVVRVRVTPTGTTSTVWFASITGYLR
jgi:hypothetical protein